MDFAVMLLLSIFNIVRIIGVLNVSCVEPFPTTKIVNHNILFFKIITSVILTGYIIVMSIG